MATLAFSLAGQVVGGLVGGPFGATLGRALGALAGSALDQAIFGEEPETALPGQVRLQGSSEGGAIPRIYGWNRLSGNIIWSTDLERVSSESSGAKGFGQEGEDEIVISFAVALCEGEVAHLGRIWADGRLLEIEGLTVRFYKGTETQAPDSLIELMQGEGNAPAYRGLCYLVFERLPLKPFGNRIPQISAELCRVVGDLEPAVRAITLIPGATEYGYDPEPRVRLVSPGVTDTENTHLLSQTSDWTYSLDELQALFPNLQHVALVVAWFGDDLRCGNCLIQPRVENATRSIEDATWTVGGLGRDDVPVMTQHDGGPAYGGTPSDPAVMAAIADLKARGLSVTLYPFVLMDIATDNALTDPYSGSAGQPPYPWRGRITCDPAPGVSGTPDQSGAAATQVSALVGAAGSADFTAVTDTIAYSGPGEWSYRRMVLHYAHLAVQAGGVETFLIGSELRGLTTIRSGATTFPFVDALCDLAGDVRSVVGGGTKITYGADWSEYSGYQPADTPGDRLFHLDKLWANPNIDAIGIDNYMPLSDWRGGDHDDAGDWASIYDPDYLAANMAGGEGYDWYYASDTDRLAGTRTPITDGAHGEPWVWRYKDLVSWWSNTHHDRIGGIRQPSPTAWVPESKPIYLTEVGCGSVDKGANQPNLFTDPKSFEDGRPYFSAGTPDPLIQRQFLRAHHNWWRPDAPGFNDTHNPVSGSYAGRMIDPDRLYVWTWDARPFPAFPQQASVWSDGPNHALGHWLTGRAGAAGSGELLEAMGADFGVTIARTESTRPLLHGLRVDGVTSMRRATDSLGSACGLVLRDRPGGLEYFVPDGRLVTEIAAADLVQTDTARASRRRPDPGDIVGRLALSFSDHEASYRAGTVTAIALDGPTGEASTTNLVLDTDGARIAAEGALFRARQQADTLEFALPPSFAALEAGDVVDLEGQSDGPFVITEIRDGTNRQITAKALQGVSEVAFQSSARQAASSSASPKAVPVIAGAQLPPEPGGDASRLILGAYASPWPGSVSLVEQITGTALATLVRNTTMGELTTPLASGPTAVWDNANTPEILIYGGHVASAEQDAVLAGGNRLLVEKDDGSWELIGFAEATLIGASAYRLEGLLRGLDGTGHGLSSASAGNRVMVFDAGTLSITLPDSRVGIEIAATAYASSTDATGTALSLETDTAPLKPLAPVHLRAEREPATGDITLNWVRCSRDDTGSWALAEAPLDVAPESYLVTIFDGEDPVRTIEPSTSGAVYSAAQQTADFGGPAPDFDFKVAQVSPVYGPGHSTQGQFNG